MIQNNDLFAEPIYITYFGHRLLSDLFYYLNFQINCKSRNSRKLISIDFYTSDFIQSLFIGIGRRRHNIKLLVNVSPNWQFKLMNFKNIFGQKFEIYWLKD